MKGPQPKSPRAAQRAAHRDLQLAVRFQGRVRKLAGLSLAQAFGPAARGLGVRTVFGVTGNDVLALNRVVDRDAVIALDVGAFARWFDRDSQAEAQKVLLSSRWRSMGAGLPAAIASQVVIPERQAIDLVGDGGLLMSLGELTTTVKYRLPLAVVVANNRLCGLEKDKTLAANPKPLGLEVEAPDFAAYTRACGARGFTVRDPAGLEDTLREALAQQETSLVDVICQDARLPVVG